MQQFFKNAAEVWASSPHLRSKLYLQQIFPAAIAFIETYQFAIWLFLWNKLQIRTKQRGNCCTLVGKSRGGTPFCRTLKTVFSKSRIFCKAFPLQLFHWNSCKILVFCSGLTRRSGLVRPASKSCRFSYHPLRVPKAWHRDFAACGQRSGLLALNLANIFEKLLDQKTFSCLRQYSWKTTRIRFGKAGAHSQLAWESQFSLRFYLRILVQFDLLRKCGLLAHTSAAFLKNCCTEKLFSCLRLVLF